jgi:tripartite-type tricarboxylate transporter receptor subunit TctC
MGMPHSRRAIVCASAALTGTATFAAPASAQSVAEFYKGKTIAILMGTRPGGSYDLYGRVVGEHPFRHIPGNPTINMEHMPSAGGVITGNHLCGPGPQDGSKILLSILGTAAKGAKRRRRRHRSAGLAEA